MPAKRGGRLSFLSVTAKVVVLTAQALALKEGLHVLRRRMEKDADDHERIAEMCAEAEVEPKFTGLITEASVALRKVAEASGGLANAADDMEVNARAFGDAHEREYRGVYETVQTSGVRQAKAGFYRKRKG
ncbi:conjugal transfer protein TraB [Streptomyces sp. M19]